MDSTDPHKKKKHKKRKLEDISIGDPESLECDSHPSKTKKKKKKSKVTGSEAEDVVIVNDGTDDSGPEKKKKKHKHKKKLCQNDLQSSEGHEVMGSTSQRAVTEESGEEKVIRKEKKKKHRNLEKTSLSSDTTLESPSECGRDTESRKLSLGDQSDGRHDRDRKKSKKKHKTSLCKEKAIEIEDCQSSGKKSKKHKKSRKGDETETRPETDTSGCSSNDGGTRQLSAENRKATGKASEVHAVLGQWGTASFESGEQKNKFLRLLGGFKKGDNSASTVPSGQPKTAPTFQAMDRRQESDYRRKMENQFDKALTYKLQRGSGLGFEQPPDAGKTFYIDKSTSRSKKFD